MNFQPSENGKTLLYIAGKPNECKITMKFIRPKIIGTLQIEVMMAGNLAVKNDIKNSPNKILVQCRSYEHGEEIIARIKESKPGEVLHL